MAKTECQANYPHKYKYNAVKSAFAIFSLQFSLQTFKASSVSGDEKVCQIVLKVAQLFKDLLKPSLPEGLCSIRARRCVAFNETCALIFCKSTFLQQ